jgi:MATE family multidrug resistance protein
LARGVTAPAPASAPFATRLAAQWRALFTLAWPVALSRAGMLLMAMANVVMVGRYDTQALAELSLGYAVFIPVFVAGVGCTVGIVSTTARGMGAGSAELPAIALRGLRWSTLVGVVAMLLIFGAEPLLRAIGHAPELAAGGGAVARVYAPGALFQILFGAASFYLEGTGRMKPGLVAMLVANLINLALSWLLIWGELGAPELGATGAALAATIARLVMVAGLLVWMLRLPEFDPWRGRLRGLWGPGGWAAGEEMRRIGVAAGAAYFFETFAFATLVQAAGLLGTAPLAAYTILHNVEAMVFMVALGISVATAVQVGHAAGAGEPAEARFAGLAGLAAAMGLIGLTGLVLLAFAPSVVAFYSSDASLVARAAPLLAILAVSMVFDAGQVVAGQCTRALGDGWGTTVCFFLAFWVVMVPVSMALAFATPLAEAGLFIGTGIGCAAALALLLHRLLRLLARAGTGRHG